MGDMYITLDVIDHERSNRQKRENPNNGILPYLFLQG